MECIIHIEVKEPEAYDMLFHPFVTFRFEQLNFTPQCMTELEIDEQVNLLLSEVESLRKKCKKALVDANSRHDKLLRSNI